MLREYDGRGGATLEREIDLRLRCQVLLYNIRLGVTILIDKNTVISLLLCYQKLFNMEVCFRNKSVFKSICFSIEVTDSRVSLLISQIQFPLFALEEGGENLIRGHGKACALLMAAEGNGFEDVLTYFNHLMEYLR